MSYKQRLSCWSVRFPPIMYNESLLSLANFSSKDLMC